jgi:hypothetical protein
VEIGEGWRDSRERLEMLEMHTGELEMRGEYSNSATSHQRGISDMCNDASRISLTVGLLPVQSRRGEDEMHPDDTCDHRPQFSGAGVW